MDPTIFVRPSGTLLTATSEVSRREYYPFVPDPLPPRLSSAEIGEVAPLLAAASQAFGKLAGVSQILPNADLLVRPYMRREAILSSRIENTYTSFSDLMAFEASGAGSASADTRDVRRYVDALEYGLRHVFDAGITLDLVRTIHRHLLTGAHGAEFSTPGEVRLVQNHIGGTGDPADARYVPPPPEAAADCLDQLVAYLAQPKADTPTMVEAAWMHYQFEAIHPFLDGNGRVGRVLIPLLFAVRNEMDHPLLYLSPYFERDRSRYYDIMLAVSTRSAWIDWLRYFLEGVRDQSERATVLSSSIIALGQEWHERLTAAKASQNAHRLADFVHRHAAVEAKAVRLTLGVSNQTAYNLIEALVRVDVLRELPGYWPQVYIAHELQRLMENAR